MTPARIILCAAVAATSLAACASELGSDQIEAKLKEATATAIPGVPAAEVTISNQKSTPASVRWRAAAGGKTYDCDADNMLRLPDCQLVS